MLGQSEKTGFEQDVVQAGSAVFAGPERPGQVTNNRGIGNAIGLFFLLRRFIQGSFRLVRVQGKDRFPLLIAFQSTTQPASPISSGVSKTSLGNARNVSIVRGIVKRLVMNTVAL